MPADWSRAALVRWACIDPWALAEQVEGADAGAVGNLAELFRAAGVAAGVVSGDGRGADEALAAAYRNNGQAVFDVAASGAEGRGLLSDDGVLMEEVARILVVVGETLAATQETVRREVRGLEADVADTVRRRNVHLSDSALTPEAVEAVDQRFFQQAADLVGVRGRAVQRAIDDYDALLANRVGHLRDLGYEAAVRPPEKNWADRAAEFGADVLEGIGSAVTGTVESLGELNPLRLRDDPGSYGEDLLRYADGLGKLGEGLVSAPLTTLDQVFTGGNIGKGQPGVAVGEGIGGVLAGGVLGRLGRLGRLDLEGEADRAHGSAPASSAVSGRDLARSLASEQQVTAPGTPIIGAGTRVRLVEAERLARDYGGSPDDWVKMTSSGYRGADGDRFETHWYENVVTGERFEFKTKRF